MSFQSTVLMIAAGVLILSLTYIGYMISKLMKNRKYPPTISRCPDYFELVKEGDREYCKNTRNLGSGVATFPIDSELSTFTEQELLNMDEQSKKEVIKFLHTHNLTWDGIQL